MSRHDTMMTDTMMTELTIWLDGDCPLCSREVALMQRLDRRAAIHFIDARCVDAELCPVDRATLLARFHARENGQMLSGAAAFVAMWRAIPLLRPLGLLARHRPILKLLERLYIVFLGWRPLFQRMARGTKR